MAQFGDSFGCDEPEATNPMLLEMFSLLTPGQRISLQRKCSQNPNQYRQFLELSSQARENALNADFQRERLEAESEAERENQRQFHKELSRHMEAYRKRARAEGRKGTRTELYTEAGFDHNSWNRMQRANGRGAQYARNLKCLCVLFHLDYQQANEFLMLANHTFDLTSQQDYYLIQCLMEGRWNPEQVDQYLAERKQPPLFYR